MNGKLDLSCKTSASYNLIPILIIGNIRNATVNSLISNDHNCHLFNGALMVWVNLGGWVNKINWIRSIMCLISCSQVQKISLNKVKR